MKKTVSYIFPIYNEAGNIPLLYATINGLLATNPRYTYELIFVNDGSKDASLGLLRELQQRDTRVVVIDFSRNFGHQLAVTAGLDYAHGDAVVIMDSDMQDPPQVSMELIKKWEDGYDVVYARRRSRQDTRFKKITAYFYYRSLQKLADIDLPPDTGDFRLLDRKVVDVMKRFKEHHRFLRGIASYVGFSQAAVVFDRDKRYAGATGYPLKKMVRFAADGIFSFSVFPLTLISRIGYLFSAISFSGILYALAMKLFSPGAVVAGWTFIIIAILLVGGVQLIMLGVLGSYIGRIYTEAQNRPLYIINTIYTHGSDSTQ